VTDLPVLLGLAAAAGLAGFVDAIAGGGGLVQLPPLLAVLGPEWAPGVNKVASVCGTTAATVRYADHGLVRWRVAALAAPLAFAFGFAGSVSYLRFVREAAHLVRPVFAICFLALAAQQVVRVLSREPPPAARPSASPWIGAAFVAAIGAYDGFVGPGTGMFLFWTFSTWFALPALHATGTTKAVNLASNVGALTAFVARGAVLWPEGLGLAAANLVGGWLGARTAIRRGVPFIRLVTAAVSAAASVHLLLA
jgi:uncharacterized membrane protein YfcA